MKLNVQLKTLLMAPVASVVLGCLSGCVTPPSQLCPAPREFDKTCKNGWLSSEARPIVENGQIRSIILDTYWYAQKYAQYTFDLPKDARDVGFRQKKCYFFLSYVTGRNTRILEQWQMENDSVGGGFLVPPVTAPTFTIFREWQQKDGGPWALTFQYDTGVVFGLGQSVKRRVKPN